MSATPQASTRPEVSARRLVATVVVLAVALAAVMAACSLVGVASLSWPTWQMRMLRILAAAIVGAGLATAGAVLQSLLRNPLASPYILGISTGAGVGVLTGLILLEAGVGALWLNEPALAAVGALATMAVVYAVAQRRGRLDPLSLLLTGVIVNAFNGAIMLFIQVYLSPNILADYIHWAMGMVPEAPSPWLLASTAGLTGAGWLYLFGRSQAFNVQSLGDDVASSSGVNVHRLRLTTFAVASLITAAAVALAGPIGFVGLIVPHLARLVLGADHRRLLIASGFVGAMFLVLADTFCRATVLRFGGELPVGILTALMGGPFFLLLLRRRLGEGL